MKNKALYIVLLVFISNGLFSQSVGDYRTTVSADWSGALGGLIPDAGWEIYTAGTPNYWDPTSAPTSISSTVYIENKVSNSSTSITINSGGKIIITPGNSLSTASLLTNNAGVGGIVLQADASGAGQLKHSNTLNGTVQTYLSASSWHLIGNPVDGSVNTSVFDGAYLQIWDEPTGWIWNDEAGFNTTFARGYGLSYWLNSAKTYTYTGSLLGSDFPYTNLPYSSAAMGYSLLANPYSCALKFSSTWNLPAGMEQSVQVWGAVSGSYTVIEDSDPTRIPSRAGFFVKTNASGQDFSIPVAETETSSTSNPYKSTEEDSRKMAKIFIQNTANEYADEVRFQFKENASQDYSVTTDISKIYGSAQSPDIFILTDDDKSVASKGISSNQASTLQMQLRPNVDATYKITVSAYTFDQNTEVLLEDLFTSKLMTIDQNLEYTFTSGEGDLESRFKIYVTPSANSTNQATLENQFKIYGSENTLRVLTTDNNYKLMVYNLLGQKLVEMTNLNGNSELDLSAYKQKIIIVSLQNDLGLISKKIQLR